MYTVDYSTMFPQKMRSKKEEIEKVLRNSSKSEEEVEDRR
jgi:hypothetical protein